MSRVKQQPPPAQLQKTQNKTDPAKSQNAQKAGGESAFASRLNKKQDKAKPKQSSPQQSSAKPGAASQGSEEKSALLKRQGGPVLGRRGGGNTVADLQARLESKAGLAADGKSNNASLSGQKLDGEPNQELVQNNDAASLQFQQGAMGSKEAAPQSATFQVQGAKIPTAMLDKMVNHARVGVNSAGNPEFQFDLKGDVLGGMKMRMSMENGQLKAIFVAENPEVKRLIDGNLHDLRKALEDRGIHIKDLEVRDPKEDHRERQKEQHNKDRQDANTTDS